MDTTRPFFQIGLTTLLFSTCVVGIARTKAKELRSDDHAAARHNKPSKRNHRWTINNVRYLIRDGGYCPEVDGHRFRLANTRDQRLFERQERLKVVEAEIASIEQKELGRGIRVIAVIFPCVLVVAGAFALAFLLNRNAT